MKEYNCYLLDLQDSRKCIYFPGGKIEAGEAARWLRANELHNVNWLPADHQLLPLIERELLAASL